MEDVDTEHVNEGIGSLEGSDEDFGDFEGAAMEFVEEGNDEGSEFPSHSKSNEEDSSLGVKGRDDNISFFFHDEGEIDEVEGVVKESELEKCKEEMSSLVVSHVEDRDLKDDSKSEQDDVVKCVVTNEESNKAEEKVLSTDVNDGELTVEEEDEVVVNDSAGAPGDVVDEDSREYIVEDEKQNVSESGRSALEQEGEETMSNKAANDVESSCGDGMNGDDFEDTQSAVDEKGDSNVYEGETELNKEIGEEEDFQTSEVSLQRDLPKAPFLDVTEEAKTVKDQNILDEDDDFGDFEDAGGDSSALGVDRDEVDGWGFGDFEEATTMEETSDDHFFMEENKVVLEEEENSNKDMSYLEAALDEAFWTSPLCGVSDLRSMRERYISTMKDTERRCQSYGRLCWEGSALQELLLGRCRSPSFMKAMRDVNSSIAGYASPRLSNLEDSDVPVDVMNGGTIDVEGNISNVPSTIQDHEYHAESSRRPKVDHIPNDLTNESSLSKEDTISEGGLEVYKQAEPVVEIDLDFFGIGTVETGHNDEDDPARKVSSKKSGDDFFDDWLFGAGEEEFNDRRVVDESQYEVSKTSFEEKGVNNDMKSADETTSDLKEDDFGDFEGDFSQKEPETVDIQTKERTMAHDENDLESLGISNSSSEFVEEYVLEKDLESRHGVAEIGPQTIKEMENISNTKLNDSDTFTEPSIEVVDTVRDEVVVDGMEFGEFEGVSHITEEATSGTGENDTTAEHEVVENISEHTTSSVNAQRESPKSEVDEFGGRMEGVSTALWETEDSSSNREPLGPSNEISLFGEFSQFPDSSADVGKTQKVHDSPQFGEFEGMRNDDKKAVHMWDEFGTKESEMNDVYIWDTLGDVGAEKTLITEKDQNREGLRLERLLSDSAVLSGHDNMNKKKTEEPTEWNLDMVLIPEGSVMTPAVTTEQQTHPLGDGDLWIPQTLNDEETERNGDNWNDFEDFQGVSTEGENTTKPDDHDVRIGFDEDIGRSTETSLKETKQSEFLEENDFYGNDVHNQQNPSKFPANNTAVLIPQQPEEEFGNFQEYNTGNPWNSFEETPSREHWNPFE